MVMPGQSQQPVVPQPMDIKWGGLRAGGSYKTPLKRFIGRLDGWGMDTGSTFGMRIQLKYSGVQVLETDAAYPWATVDVSIKYSDSENSGWGTFVASVKKLGIATNAQSFPEAMQDMVGKIYEMVKTHESFGDDKDGKAMAGDVWRAAQILQAQAQVQPQPVVAAPTTAPAPAPAPSPVAAQPTYVQPTVAPAPAQPMAVPAGIDLTLLPTDTAEIRAKKLLHNKQLNEFLQVALVDDVIKANTAFLTTIFNQSFIIGLKGNGQVVQDPNTQKFFVVK